MKKSELEIEWYGSTAVVNGIPKKIDPYDMLMYCDNVEHEGGNQYRFDNVYPETRKEFVAVLSGKKRHPHSKR